MSDMSDPNVNGATVIARTSQTIYIRLPRALWRPIDRCSCPTCKRTGEPPYWDTLAVATNKPDGAPDSVWTVHMPDPREMIAHAAEMAAAKTRKRRA